MRSTKIKWNIKFCFKNFYNFLVNLFFQIINIVAIKFEVLLITNFTRENKYVNTLTIIYTYLEQSNYLIKRIKISHSSFRFNWINNVRGTFATTDPVSANIKKCIQRSY